MEITLSWHNRIASCSIDKTIKIWCSKPPYIKMPIKILKGHSRDVSSILYIKERDIMISGSKDSSLRLWNMSTYQCYTVIEGVECCWNNSLYQIDNDRLIVGENGSFSIINIDICVIEKRIADGHLGEVFLFLS